MALLLAMVGMLGLSAGVAQAELPISRFSASFTDPAGPPGNVVTQAGAHADLVVDFGFAQHPDSETGVNIPVESAKNLEFDFPAGFYGNPQNMPFCDTDTLMSLNTFGFCPVDTQVGTADVQIGADPNVYLVGTYRTAVYNVQPDEGHTATLAFVVFGFMFRIDVSPRTDGDYGLQARLTNVAGLVPLYGTTMRLWGVPADPVHDAVRKTSLFDPGGHPSGLPRQPFVTMPARCVPLSFSMRATSWQHPESVTTASSTTPPLTGCDALKFEPKITAKPAKTQVDTPTGFDVDVTVPQENSWSGLGTPQLRKATVTLPEGVAVSPSSAQGLEGCSDAQLKLGSRDAPVCPDASKIGTVSIDTPLLPDPLTGDIVLGTPKSGALFRLFLVARGSGMVLKLPGIAQPNAQTGQLTTTFDNTPQLPFTKLHLHFKGGDRAPLATPQSCGTKTTTSELVPWAGPTGRPSDSFDITGCTGGFAPTYEAGTTNPEAGAFSPFTMTIRRKDGDQELSGIQANLPPGLLGILAGIPQCPETQVVAGTCSDASQLGTTTVESGSGDQPLPLTGKVFLAGAYKGQPYSLAFVVRAVAGPFDLGTVIIRAPLNIDASGGKVSVAADALPTILEGVPLRLRTINVTLDRPGFMFNPTNCTPMAVGATLTSVNGAVSTPSSRFQALGCGDLPLKPVLKIRLTGGKKEMGKKGHPGVTADLSQTPGQAGLKKAVVPLPAGVSVDLKNLGNICSVADAAARKCADSAIVGRARVKTPALPGELTGPVYFVVGDRSTGGGSLPRLWLKLSGGGVPLDLWANTTITGGRVISTFTGIPDAPISTFHLEIDGGAKGILQTARNQCPAARTSKTVFEGQNGRVLRHTVRFGTDCAPRISKTKVTNSTVSVTVTGIGAGRLAVSGRGVLRASTSIKSSDKATITAKLSAATKRVVARSGRARLQLAVRYTPVAGKGTTLRKTVSIRRR